MVESFTTDVAIFGGGIAGLWLFRRLANAGFSPVLIEKDSLGSGQTLAAQGIIHGGLKYSLEGVLSEHTQSLASMPQIWKDCLAGRGEPNLTGVKILSDRQYMWSQGTFAENLVSFFASKVMHAKVEPVSEDQWPLLFQNPGFRGKIYQLPELVIDTKSVIRSLAGVEMASIYRSEQIEIRRAEEGIQEVALTAGTDEVLLRAKYYVFTAGTGNEFFAEQIGFNREITQRRPLRMFMVADAPASLYGHCLAKGNKPRVTISTHPWKNRHVWYLGGAIAEKAVEMSLEESMAWGKSEMKAIFPWVEWDSLEWKVFDVDRAEPRQSNHLLPSEPLFISQGNALLAWPTKMVFAPALSAKVLNFLRKNNVKPGADSSLLPLGKPEVGIHPWEGLF